jgi:hypothetical protein
MDTTHQCRYSNETAVNARIRRQTLTTVLMLAMVSGDSDGVTWANCVGCGERAHVGGTPRAMDTFNLGHVLADAEGGMYCPCNLLPLCRQCNADMGKETLTDVLVPVYDNRGAWDGKLMADTGAVAAKPESNRGRASWKVPASV